MNLFGLGDPSAVELQHAAEALAKSGPLSALSVKAFLLLLPKKTWGDAAVALINQGVSAAIVYEGNRLAQEATKIPWKTIAGVATVTSAAISGFHGYRRNQSVGWAVWWFTMGMILPVVTPVIATAQGLGKRKS